MTSYYTKVNSTQSDEKFTGIFASLLGEEPQ